MEVLGIDFGGSGIKGAPVDVVAGKLLAERFRVTTPEGARPEDVAQCVLEIKNYFNWNGIISVGFPAAIKHGIVQTASNIDSSWIGVNASEFFEKYTGCEVYLLNDADAAGMAEMRYGAGKSEKGTVALVTVGTGLGTAIFTRGHLLPNTELGHLFLGDEGKEAEEFAADSARKKKELPWNKWAKRFHRYLQELERLFFPDLIIIGGGVSKKPEKFMEFLEAEPRVSRLDIAHFLNEAGMIGAAIYGAEEHAQYLSKRL